jgi:23S rRNA (guanosine2251-2'-O)-methyltransferase
VPPNLYDREPSLTDRKRKMHHRGGRPPSREQISSGGKSFWLYGLHAARAALANPKRKVKRAVLNERARDELKRELSSVPTETASPDTIARLLPPGSVHQGVALLCEPLPQLDLETALENAALPRVVAVLDQVTDPHNEGAILRSAAAFGVAAVVVQDRHAPEESGALAKAASGALDIVPRVVATNIARALEELGEMGFWRIALAGDADAKLAGATRPGDIALVLGAEGAGIRRLVRERCDIAAYIPMTGDMESLNVSNAAAVAFYELSRR